MKKQLLAVAVAALACVAAQADTLAKVKSSGAITMGVRDSSGALSYTRATASTPVSMSKFASALWPTSKKPWAKKSK